MSANILHVGCGRKKRDATALMASCGLGGDWSDAEVMHLDADARLEPDVVCTLGDEPIPLPDNSVDLIVAWHVLEHVGKQGESAAWFRCWEELYRVLVPGGWIYGESPYYSSIWAWSDPTHTRAISEHSFIFFAQAAYRVDGSMISPYQIHCDFSWVGLEGMPKGWALISDRHEPKVQSIRFALGAIKPLKPWWVN